MTGCVQVRVRVSKACIIAISTALESISRCSPPAGPGTRTVWSSSRGGTSGINLGITDISPRPTDKWQAKVNPLSAKFLISLFLLTSCLSFTPLRPLSTPSTRPACRSWLRLLPHQSFTMVINAPPPLPPDQPAVLRSATRRIATSTSPLNSLTLFGPGQQTRDKLRGERGKILRQL